MNPLLSDLFERQYAPLHFIQSNPANRGGYRTRFRVAIRWFTETIGRPARAADLTRENLDQLAQVLVSAGYRRQRIMEFRRALAALWRFADRLGVAPSYVASAIEPVKPINLPGQGATAPLRHWRRGQRITLPPPAPGTWRHYFETVYRPRQLQVASEATLLNYRSLFISWWRWRGGDLRIEDSDDDLAAAYFAWKLASGCSPRSVNRLRAHWFAIWRHAAETKAIGAPPTFRKLPVERNPPDAWSMEQLAALLAATRQLTKCVQRYNLAHGPMMRAVLLVGFHTAVRRRSLFAIRCRDVDLTSGWVTIYGRNVKTRKGRRFKLPPYAVEAVRQIYDADRELLFPIGAGYSIKLFAKLVAIAGLPKSDHALGYFHKLRRSAATQAVNLGGVRTAAELLDHTQEYVTLLYVDTSKLAGTETGCALPTIGPRQAKLAEARELLAIGKPHLAAIAARIAIEQTLDALCRASGKPLESCGMVRMARSLYGRRAISDSLHADILRVAKVANAAAHGEAVEAAAVAELIQVAERVAGDDFRTAL